jgi:hypothetical protein
MKYRNIMTKNIVTVSELIVAGMCNKTIGLTLVVNKENETDLYSKAMESRQFHDFHKKVIK